MILKRVSEVNYKIAKPTAKTKWKVVHFNNLKPYVDEDSDANRQLRPRGAATEQDRIGNKDPADDDGADDEEDREPAIRGAPPEISPGLANAKLQVEERPTTGLTRLRNGVEGIVRRRGGNGRL